MNKWKFVAGNPAVDYVNSIGGRNDKKDGNSFLSIIRDEKLNSYADLLDWSVEIGLINQFQSKILSSAASSKPKASEKVFERAKTLRETLYRIFKHYVEDKTPLKHDLGVLNNEISLARDKQELIFSQHGFKWELDSKEDELDIPVNKIALSAAELFISDNLSHLKQCRGTDCGWLFIDTSKNHSRLWCDMKDCGNSEKVRRFRNKQK